MPPSNDENNKNKLKSESENSDSSATKAVPIVPIELSPEALTEQLNLLNLGKEERINETKALTTNSSQISEILEDFLALKISSLPEVKFSEDIPYLGSAIAFQDKYTFQEAIMAIELSIPLPLDDEHEI